MSLSIISKVLLKNALIIILILNIISKFACKYDLNSSILKDFRNSIYFSDIDPLSSLDFEREMDRPHKVDLMILKMEKMDKNEMKKDGFDNKLDFFQLQKKSKTFLNVKLSKNFYDVNFCIDEIDSPNKNQIFKEMYNIKPKKKSKLSDFSHKDIISLLEKNDFTIIDPKSYNEGKRSSRYNNNQNLKEAEVEDEEFNFEIKREFEKCYKKFEFLNKDSPRFKMKKTENFNLIKILNQTYYKVDSESNYNHILDDYLNVKLFDLLINIKNYVNDIIKWENENVIVELNFIFENRNLNDFLSDISDEVMKDKKIDNLNKLSLEKIFVYFMKMPNLELSSEIINQINSENSISAYEESFYSNTKNNKDYYISLIQTYKNFENIFIDYKFLNKQIKYTKSYLDTKKHKITTKSLELRLNKTNPMIKSFSTLQRESIFHNRVNFIIDLEKTKNEILTSNKNNKICFLIYQHLTEDTFIEKNEFKSHINKLFYEYEKFYFFSDEIDQEISSDISKQYFASFAICTSIEFFRNKFYDEKIKENSENNILEVSFPIHFRYQPPIYYTSHQEVFLNLPLIEITIQEDQIYSLEKSLLNNNILNENYDIKRALNYKNNRKQIKDLRKIFNEEIIQRIRLINEYKNMFNNLTKIRHFIPVGKMEHLYYVMAGTFIVTIIGFFIIVFGIINNKIKEKIN